jgi:hypothetical protein
VIESTTEKWYAIVLPGGGEEVSGIRIVQVSDFSLPFLLADLLADGGMPATYE